MTVLPASVERWMPASIALTLRVERAEGELDG
jgi:hypothetical protein